MYKLSLQRILMILAVCVIGIFYSVPNFVKDAKKTLPSWWQPVNLGLDLQGGSSLLLEVDLNSALKDRMQSLEDSARLALKDVRVRYQNISSGADGLKIRIEDANARSKAIIPLRKMDEGLTVTEQDGTLVVNYDEQALNIIKGKLVDQSIEIVRKRIDEYGTNEPIIQSQGYGRILVQLPGIQNPEEVKVLLGKTAKMTFHLVDSSTTPTEAKRGKLKSSSRVIRGSGGEQYVIVRKPAVGGETLTDAGVSFQDGAAAVSFKFNSLGAKKFGEVNSSFALTSSKNSKLCFEHISFPSSKETSLLSFSSVLFPINIILVKGAFLFNFLIHSSKLLKDSLEVTEYTKIPKFAFLYKLKRFGL